MNGCGAVVEWYRQGNRSTGRETLCSVWDRWMNVCGAVVDSFWHGEIDVLGEKHYVAWVVGDWMGVEQHVYCIRFYKCEFIYLFLNLFEAQFYINDIWTAKSTRLNTVVIWWAVCFWNYHVPLPEFQSMCTYIDKIMHCYMCSPLQGNIWENFSSSAIFLYNQAVQEYCSYQDKIIHDHHSPLSKEARDHNSQLFNSQQCMSFWAIFNALICNVKMFRRQKLYILFTCSSM